MGLVRSGGVATARRVGTLMAVVLAMGTGCGSTTSTSATDAHSPATHPPRQAPPKLAISGHSATIHLGTGRQTATLTMPETAGVILLYRINAPYGARIRATTQLPATSAPLLIATTAHTGPTAPTNKCHTDAGRVTCTVGEEWCPMPAGSWHVNLRKLSGPAGDVTVWFRVGQPPPGQAQ